jgi:hypothetical protein
MKIIPVLSLLILLLASCAAAPTAQPVAPTQTVVLLNPSAPTPTPAITITSAQTPTPTLPSTSTPAPTAVLLGESSPTPSIAAGFVEPEPEIWVDVMPAVREYLYYRKKAVVSGDVSVLWKRYPDLKQGMNAQAGINVEQNIVQIYSILKPFDGNIFPEQYEQIKVKMNGDTSEVMVHGMELYLVTFTSGKFDESGGEFRIILSLRKQGNLWTVYKTTDITMPYRV